MVGCFPHSARHRTYAQLGEGGAILAGIAISAFANTAADCDEMAVAGINNTDCRNKATWLSTAGVTLIVGGLLGFVATVSTAEPDPNDKPNVVEIKDVSQKEEKLAVPALKAKELEKTNENSNVKTHATDPSSAGSAATSPSAPQQR